MSGPALRIALVDRDREPAVHALGRALASDGHRVRVVSVRPRPSAEALLAGRGFTPGLSAVPLAAAVLLAGRFDVVHAFGMADAAAARLWGRLTGRATAFTCREVLTRATVADRRLRLTLLRSAVGHDGPVLAASAAAAAGLADWLAVEAPVLAPADATAHAELYRAAARRGGRA